jgi:thymidine kinase
MIHGDLPKVHVGTLLVLPDYAVKSAVLAYPRERVVDAADMPRLCQRVLSTFPSTETLTVTSQQVVDFFSNRFAVVPDVSNNIDQVVQASTHLASGLAEWVPKISHNSQLFVIDATAGSGKTQLALSLLQSAAKQKQSACYVCFNRPLADHLTKLAPSSVEVTTFHQLCRDWFERKGNQLDFTDADIFQRMTKQYIEDCNQFTNSLDLLVIDESQDFEPSWANAIIKKLKNNGKLYVMGDSDQQLYSRESFDLEDAVHVRCMDNFRSPLKVVQVINSLGLSKEHVVARSAYAGATPYFYTWVSGAGSSMVALDECLKQLWKDGYKPEQVAVVTFQGVKNSEVLKQEKLSGYKTRRFSRYDAYGNAIWTDGALLVESVYRFKGQSMPVVVFCEVDFEELTDKVKHKLFVGLTRGQVRIDLVISEASAKHLLTLDR